MKRQCAYCGSGRFGLVRHWGYYVRGYFLVQLHFCTKRHKQLFEAEYARAARERPVKERLAA
jgi:hypothetical protein